MTAWARFACVLGMGRMNYRVQPGLYALGRPTPESLVLVSANFKLSVDHLRTAVRGLDAWILVLDTHGINVWCAAGKGLFGTDEVVRQVERAGLSSRVSHRTLVLPQLAAPGVAAHDVRRRTGFRVVYGPVRAADIPAFLAARMTATPEMRQVRYDWRDRAVLIPVEVVTGARYPVAAAIVLALLALFVPRGVIARERGVRRATAAAAGLTSVAFLAGTVLGPLLLPWLPGRAFALKGAVLGLAVALALAVAGGRPPRSVARAARVGVADAHARIHELRAHELHRLLHLHVAVRRASRDACGGAAPDRGRGGGYRLLGDGPVPGHGMRYLEKAITLTFDATRCNGCAAVHAGVPPCRVRDGEQARGSGGPRRVHGVWRVRQELRDGGHHRPGRCRLRGRCPRRPGDRGPAGLRLLDRPHGLRVTARSTGVSCRCTRTTGLRTARSAFMTSIGRLHPKGGPSLSWSHLASGSRLNVRFRSAR